MTNISASHSNGNVYTSESAQGSLAFGGGNKYIHASNNSSVSKGGILLFPFLDLNNNGIFDKGEHLVKLTKVRVSGGKAIFSKKDSIVRIPDLNAFTSYNVEFGDNDLENIAWRFKKKVYQVLIDPNQFKRIDIPIVAVGEVSGMAYMNTDNSLQGIGRILVKFYNKNSTKVIAETLSESDGYIDYMGLEPGEYVARIDSGQLTKLKMVVSPELIPIKISQSFDGDIIGGLDFTLSLTKNQVPDTMNILAQVKPVIIDSAPQAITENKTLELNNNKTSIIKYEGDVIQIGAFKTKSNAFAAYKKLGEITEKPAIIVYEDGYYKVRISDFENQKLARQFASKLPELGFMTSYIPVIKPNISIQIGEFEKEEDALKVQKEVIERTGKPTIIIYKYGLYKVRTPGISVKKEAKSIIAKLAQTTYHKVKRRNRDKINSSDKMIDNKTYGAVIQVGAFVRRNNAIRIEKKLSKKTDRPIIMIFEDGFYKVRISGFSGRIQALAFVPKLLDLGFSETYVVRVK